GGAVGDDTVHLLLAATERSTDRDAVDRRGRDPLGRGTAEVLVDAALDDPEHRLARRPLGLVPGEAAVEPAVGALGRPRGVVAVGVIRRALVEDEGDVGAERRLDAHRALRAEEALGAVEVGAEADAVL